MSTAAFGHQAVEANLDAGPQLDSTANLSALLDSTEDLVWSVDLDFRIVTFNRALREHLERYFGIRIAPGTKLCEAFPAEIAVLSLPMYQRALSDGAFRVEYALAGGRTLELTFTPLLKDGQKIGVSVFGKDITHHKAAQARLLAQMERFQNIIEGTDAAYFRIGVDGCYEDVNPAWLRMHGLTQKEETIGRHFSTVYASEDQARATQIAERLLRGESIAASECSRLRRDGTLGRHTLSAVPIWHGNSIIGAEGILIDVGGPTHLGEQERTRKVELHASEARYYQLYEDMRDGYGVVDMAGHILTFNEAYRELLGYSAEELRKLTYCDLTPGKWRDVEAHIVSTQVLQRGYSDIYEKEYRRKDGTIFPIEIRTKLLKDDNGKPVGMCALVRDITDRKKAERALEEAEQKYRTIFENATVGIYQVTPQGVVIAANRAMAIMLGYESAQEVQAAITDTSTQLWLCPADRSEFRRSVEREGAVHDQECRWKKKDNTPIWVALSGRKVSGGDGQTLYYEGFVENISERKAAATKLESVNRMVAVALRTARAGAWELNLETGEFFATDECRRLLGAESTFVPTLDGFLARVHPDDRDSVRQGINESIDDRVPGFESRYRVPLADGIHWMEARGSVQCDATGKPFRLIGITSDITERHQMEAALRESEERHRAILHTAMDGVWVTDMQGRLLDVNEAYCRMSGYTDKELLTMSIADLEASEVPRETIAHLERILSSGQDRFESRHRRKDGGVFDVEISARYRSSDGGRLVAFVHDITEHKTAEKALLDAEKKYREIFEGALEGFYRTSPEGRSLVANPALARMLGYESTQEFVSACADSARVAWYEPDERSRFNGLLELHGTIRGYECRLKRKDGSPLWVSLNSRKVCAEDGHTLYYEGFVADITERKRDEEEKAKLEAQLRQAQKMESIGRLAGGVAHDFNNLLTVINGYSAIALRKMDPGGPLRQMITEIKAAGEHAAGLTKQLLAFSRKQTIQPKNMDLNVLVKDAEHMLRRMIGEDIEIVTMLDPQLGLVLADSDQIHQVLMNLVVNARDAMPNGGKLMIETNNVEVDEAAASVTVGGVPGRYVQMTVRDSGCGMTEETMQHIFEPFFTTKEHGTGLGLPMVYGIITQSGGWIDVQSELGKGARFSLYLPRIEAYPLPDQRTEISIQARGGETILLVEDQDAICKFVKEILQSCGYAVLAADSGTTACDLAARHKGEIHLLLTDVILKGISGREVAERLQTLRPNLKTLYMSGYPADVIARQGVVESGVAFMQKPFGPDELVSKVRAALTHV